MVSLPTPPNLSTQINGCDPTLSTDVDDPSHPLHHHRRVVTDFDYGDILGEGSYSTVKSQVINLSQSLEEVESRLFNRRTKSGG